MVSMINVQRHSNFLQVRAKSATDMKVEWFKDDKPLKASDRVKIISKQDDKDKDGFQVSTILHFFVEVLCSSSYM